MRNFIFAHSENGLPIEGYTFGNTGPQILILGGVHGDETEGVAMCKHIYAEFLKNFPYQLKLTLIPTFNIDGVLAGTRHNANGVDLNRNLPTNDWDKDAFNPRYYPGEEANSEKENQALVEYLENKKVDFMISYHSFSRFLMNINGDCKKEAQLMQALTSFPIDESMGYPTPGCLGTYTGLERNIPTITYELHRGTPAKQFLDLHFRALKECLKYIETNR